MGETQQDPLCSHTGVHVVSALLSLQNSASMALSLGLPPCPALVVHSTLPQHVAETAVEQVPQHATAAPPVPVACALKL